MANGDLLDDCPACFKYNVVPVPLFEPSHMTTCPECGTDVFIEVDDLGGFTVRMPTEEETVRAAAQSSS